MKKAPKCEEGGPKPEDIYDMRMLSNTFWPTSDYERQLPYNEDECRESCLHDCQCVVAVLRDVNCWKKKLPLSNGRVDPSTHGKAFIKVVQPDFVEADLSNTKKDQRTLVGSILLATSVFFNFLFVAAILVLAYFLSHNRQAQVLPKVQSLLETSVKSYTYEQLKIATDEFKEELGRGSFGTVYKGVWPSNTRNVVAVKKLDKVVQQGEEEFKTEVNVIGQTHHKNLVRLLGFCDEGQNKLLQVYEFMENGSLASLLFGFSRLDWNIRIQMAIGIERGLVYLHEECSRQIIHCDIKPQNILLDDSLTAKISDFGLAKLLMSDHTRTHTAIRGTRGYVAPEWFRNTPISAKVDVYSFGIILLEIICCRKSLKTETENEEEVILVNWAYDCYRQGRLDKLVEDEEEAMQDMKRMERLLMVAFWCIQEDPSLRPSMKKVFLMLEGVADVSLPPCPFPSNSIC